MYAETVALTAAVFFGGAAVILKKGYAYSTPLTSNLVVLGVNMSVLWTLTLLFAPPELLFTAATPWFVAGGVLGQAIARMLQYTGIHKVGPSRNHTALGSVSLFAAFFAIVFLGERWTLPLAAGTLLVFGGVMLLFMERKKQEWDKRHLLLPLAAAVIYGASISIQKTGLNITPFALIGVTTAITGAFVAILLFTLFSGKVRTRKVGKAWPFFLGAGVTNSTALVLNFEALRSGNITVVMPLIATQPLFATLFSYLFLKGMDRITWNVVAGAVAVVAGIAMVTAF